MQPTVEGIAPHVWKLEEALSSGGTAYRIGIDLSGNPFSNIPSLSNAWVAGHNDAASKDTTSRRRVDYTEEEPRHDKRRNYTDASRPRSKGFPVKPGGRGRTFPGGQSR